MTAPRRRALKITKQDKLRKALQLSPEHQQILAGIEREARTRERFGEELVVDDFGVQKRRFERAVDQHSLKGVCNNMRINFVTVVEGLSKRFSGQEIRVLFEGSGLSTFPEELEQRCARLKHPIRVKVIRTDLYSTERFRELAAKINSRLKEVRGVKITGRNYFFATPEQLVKTFGRESFHLVVSRSGGLTYTRLPQTIGISNVCEVLRSGGEAHILTEDTDDCSGNAIRVKERFGQKLTPVGELFEGNPRYQVKQEETTVSRGPYLRFQPILRITKAIPEKR